MLPRKVIRATAEKMVGKVPDRIDRVNQLVTFAEMMLAADEVANEVRISRAKTENAAALRNSLNGAKGGMKL